MATSPIKTRFSIKDNIIDGYQELLSNHEKLPTDVEIHGCIIKAGAIQLVGNNNSNDAFGANLLKIAHASSAHEISMSTNGQNQHDSQSNTTDAAPNQSRTVNGVEKTRKSSEGEDGGAPVPTKEARHGEAEYVRRQRGKHFEELKSLSSVATPLKNLR